MQKMMNGLKSNDLKSTVYYLLLIIFIAKY